ncbi:DUF1254 domain-containing protein [Sphingomonas alpina]|uniref:DUF1254 domain-containing protein n=1 Tax=Sphingomonas alpina TaxID=653931 RepID=A0A7H0LE98_9SPHN|nr:DUF1254 domain-containing protein [Sphingomonas alpina]QNQ08001.1 DUF1254 domain-containing protein [Sphingomonas alpina]
MTRRWTLPLMFGILLGVTAWQVTLIATPRMLMWLAVKRVASIGGFNQMKHTPLATAASRTIVRPSPDLAYSSCPYDLSHGPVLIEATPVTAPYWSLSIFDANTNAVFVRNDAGGMRKPLRIAIARAGQSIPAGAETVRVDGNRGVALIRILIENRANFTPIDAARRSARCSAVTG